MLINAEGYCEKSKKFTLFMNLFWKAMSIMHRANDNENNFEKKTTLVAYGTPSCQKHVVLVEKMSTKS